MFKKLFGWGRKEEKHTPQPEEIKEQIQEVVKIEDTQQTEEIEDTQEEIQEESFEIQERKEVVDEIKEEVEVFENNKLEDEALIEADNLEDDSVDTTETFKGIKLDEENFVEDVILENESSLNDFKESKVEFDISQDMIENNIFEKQVEASGNNNLNEDLINIHTEEVVEIDKNEDEDTPKGFFARLKAGLSKTTKNFTDKLTEMFECYEGVSELVYEDLEEILIMADVGFETTNYIVDTLRARVLDKTISDTKLVKEELQLIISEILSKESVEMNINDGPSIITIVGVNGVGKTTTIGKLANKYKNSGKKVVLAAADTFRAAASEQLDIWAKRADVEIVKHKEGADPSAVIFDGIKAAKARQADILICDTAGRLHNKKNLMMELEKIFRIIDREYEEANKEVLLVIDATTGQNAISQAKLFKEVAPLTGIILTKLDGTAKGGVVLGIIQEVGLPVKYIGVGEKLNDLQEFNSISFAKALFGEE